MRTTTVEHNISEAERFTTWYLKRFKLPFNDGLARLAVEPHLYKILTAQRALFEYVQENSDIYGDNIATQLVALNSEMIRSFANHRGFADE